EAVCEEPGALDCLEQLQESSLVLAEQGSGVRGQRSERQGSGVRGEGSGKMGMSAPELTPDPSPLTPGAQRLTPDPRPLTPGDGMRYRLLETLREYGEEQLGPEERAALKERHAAYYLALAEEAEPGLLGPDQRARLAQLEEEHENLRAALDWAAETGVRSQGSGVSPDKDESARLPSLASEARILTPDPWPLTPQEIGLRLGGALWWFWTARGNLAEGRGRLARLLALSGDGCSEGTDAMGSQARAKAQLCAAVLAQLQGDHAASRSLYEECLAR